MLTWLTELFPFFGHDEAPDPSGGLSCRARGPHACGRSFGQGSCLSVSCSWWLEKDQKDMAELRIAPKHQTPCQAPKHPRPSVCLAAVPKNVLQTCHAAAQRPLGEHVPRRCPAVSFGPPIHRDQRLPDIWLSHVAWVIAHYKTRVFCQFVPKLFQDDSAG